MTKVTGLSGLFQKRLKALTKAAKRIDEGNVEAVHRTRVTTRRLRELLPVLGLEGAISQKLNRRLKKATRQLGDVRQLDMLMQMTRELGQDAHYSSTALSQLTIATEKDRAAAHDRLAAKLPISKIERLARRLKRAVKKREARERDHEPRAHATKRAWVWALEARAVRRATDVRRAIEAAGTVYVPDRLHDVRVAVKKLRYAMEVAADAHSQPESPAIAALKAAQDSL